MFASKSKSKINDKSLQDLFYQLCVAYVRKSSEDKNNQVQSIEDQTEVNDEQSKLVNEEINEYFRDEKSAKIPYQRNNFTKLVELLYTKRVKYLFCWKLNRLARNMVEAGMIIDILQNGYIKAIITPSKTFYPTERTSTLASEFGESTQFSIDLSSDVKRGLHKKMKSGWRPGVSTLGYINDKYGLKGEKKIFVDPNRFDKLRQVWEKALTGKYSYMDLTRFANNNLELLGRNGNPVGKTTIIDILKNPFYYGVFYDENNVMYKGKHKPMVSKNEFDLV